MSQRATLLGIFVMLLMTCVVFAASIPAATHPAFLKIEEPGVQAPYNVVTLATPKRGLRVMWDTGNTLLISESQALEILAFLPQPEACPVVIPKSWSAEGVEPLIISKPCGLGVCQ